MKVEIVFDNNDYLYSLIGEYTDRLSCEMIHNPQDTGDWFVFKYNDKKFRVNPNFSGFLGLVEIND